MGPLKAFNFSIIRVSGGDKEVRQAWPAEFILDIYEGEIAVIRNPNLAVQPVSLNISFFRSQEAKSSRR